MLDQSTPVSYPAVVQNKSVVTGKPTRWYLWLELRGPVKHTSRISVNRQIFQHIEVGNAVRIDHRPGKFAISWYVVNSR